jgi:hypothetical protein
MAMTRNLFLITVSFVMLAGSFSAGGWNPGAKYIEALSFNDDGSIRFTLLDPDPSIYEFKCDVNGVSPWFMIDSCDVGNGNGNKSASPTCTASVERMADMLLTAKINRIPVHVQHDEFAVSQVALKPLPPSQVTLTGEDCPRRHFVPVTT